MLLSWKKLKPNRSVKEFRCKFIMVSNSFFVKHEKSINTPRDLLFYMLICFQYVKWLGKCLCLGCNSFYIIIPQRTGNFPMFTRCFLFLFSEQVKTAERVQLDQIPLPEAPIATPTSKVYSIWKVGRGVLNRLLRPPCSNFSLVCVVSRTVIFPNSAMQTTACQTTHYHYYQTTPWHLLAFIEMCVRPPPYQLSKWICLKSSVLLFVYWNWETKKLKCLITCLYTVLGPMVRHYAL